MKLEERVHPFRRHVEAAADVERDYLLAVLHDVPQSLVRQLAAVPDRKSLHHRGSPK